MTTPLGNDLEPGACVVGELVGILEAGGVCVDAVDVGDPSVCVLATAAGTHIVWPGEDLVVDGARPR